MGESIDRPAADGRRARGDATRRTAARAAARIATVSGLDSITVGGLAAETGLSKSGILTVFGSRQNIQVAAVAEARKIYRDTVIAPAWGEEPGRARLHAMLRCWADYIRSEVFPGGCFLAATSVEFGHRGGAVADSVRRLKREWLDVLEADLSAAAVANPVDSAFCIDAFLCAANARYQLYGDEGELDRGLRLASDIVDRP